MRQLFFFMLTGVYVLMLVSIGCTRSRGGQLMSAIEDGNLQKVEQLIAGDIDINKQYGFFEELPIAKAAEAGHIEIVKLLIEHGASVNNKNMIGETALYCAAKKGDTDIVALLIDKGADPNIKPKGDEGYHIPLLTAAEGGHYPIVNLLIDGGAKVNAGDDFSNTALIFACRKGHQDIAKILIEKGAHIDHQKSQEGTTSLMFASQKGYADIVALLLDNGAEVNCKDNSGRIALMFACIYGRLDVIKRLVKAGANVNDTSDNNMSVLGYVGYGITMQRGDPERYADPSVYEEISAYLKSKGAR